MLQHGAGGVEGGVMLEVVDGLVGVAQQVGLVRGLGGRGGKNSGGQQKSCGKCGKGGFHGESF